MAGLLPEALRRELSTFVKVTAPETKRWLTALRITISVAVATLIVAAILGPQAAMLGLVGAQLAITAPERPVRDRAQVLAALVGIYVLATAIGLVASYHPYLALAILPVIATVTILGYNAVVADPPGAMFLILGAVAASYLPTTGVDRGLLLLVSVLAPSLACLTSLALDVLRGYRPETHALDDARLAVAEFVTADPGDDPVRLATLRDQAYASVVSAGMTLSAARGSRANETGDEVVELRGLHLQAVERISKNRLNGAPIAVDELSQMRYLGAPSTDYLVRWGLSRASLPWLSARRAGLSMAAAYGLALALKLPHPNWAALTVALLLVPGTDRISLTHRAFHRLAGTVIGLGLFLALHQLNPTGYLLLAIEFVLIFLIHQTVTLNYALGVTFVTPMALLLVSSVPKAEPVAELMGTRVLETSLGVLAATIVIWGFARREPVALARRQFRRALNALLDVLRDLASGKARTAGGLVRRRDLLFEQLQTAQILRIAQRDLPELKSWEGAEAALNQLSYVTLAACWTTHPQQALDAGAMATELRNMIWALPPISTTNVNPDQVAESLCRVWSARG